MLKSTYMIAFVCLISFYSVSARSAEFYENRQYGFSVEIPDGATRCTVDPGTNTDGTPGLYTQDHGASIFLDNRSGDCAELHKHPAVNLYAAYNVLDERLDELAQSWCSLGKIKFRLVEPPQNLGFNFRPSHICRMDADDGWANIQVITQGGKQPGPPLTLNTDVPLVNYSARLRTTEQRFETDLLRFRAILGTVRFFQPE